MNVLFGTDFSVKTIIIEYFNNHSNYNIKFLNPEKYDEATVLRHATDADVIISPAVTKEFLEKAIKLKHIQIPWTGSERIDFELLKKYPSITVSNSHSNSLTIAEHAVALLLAAAKQINYRDSYMRKYDWSPRDENVMYSIPLIGMTAGIIGYGAIGQKAAKMLKHGFDMKILAIKKNISNIPADGIYDFLGGMNDIDKVLQESDFIIVALPLTAETKGIIGKKEFNLMKDGAIIVNIARGPIIDEQSLYEFLKSKKGYAGIDTWYNYPERSDPKNPDKKVQTKQNFPFEELENLTMSPHSAFKVADIGRKTGEDIIKNLVLLADGKKPINIINPESGY